MFEATIEGNLTRDPELRFTQAGKPWATFGIAVNFRAKQMNDEWKDTGVMFIDVACFGYTATGVAEHVRKGDKVLVTGRLTKENFVGRDGVERESIKVAASSVGKVMRAEVQQAQPADPWASSAPFPQDDAPPF